MPNRMNNQSRSEANNIIRDIANYYSNNDCYLIDLEGDELYSNEIIVACETQRVNHFNSLAYNIMSSHIMDLTNKYIYDNYTEFMQLEFIGTDYSWS